MTRYDKIKNMSIEELAGAIVKCQDYYNDDYCKSTCNDDVEGEGCPHPEKCCKRWLLEEVEE